MIQANELRIGSWINADGLNCKVIDITEEDGKYLITHKKDEYGKYTLYPHNIEPIQLTPEVLEKAGFIVDDFGYHKKTLPEGNVLGIWVEDAIWIYNDLSTAYNEITLTRPVSLHQLQNLYHALTGEELNVVL